jgi:hypothetical protein
MEKLKGRDNVEDLVADGKIILELMLVKYCVKVWTGCIWIRIRTSDGLLPTQ